MSAMSRQLRTLRSEPGKRDSVWILYAKKLASIANEIDGLAEGDVANLAMELGLIFPAN